MPPIKKRKTNTFNPERASGSNGFVKSAILEFGENPEDFIKEYPKTVKLIAQLTKSMYMGYEELTDLVNQFDDCEFPDYTGVSQDNPRGNILEMAQEISSFLENLPSSEDATDWNNLMNDININILNMGEDDILEEIEKSLHDEESDTKTPLAAEYAIRDVLKLYLEDYCNGDKINETAKLICTTMLGYSTKAFEERSGNEQIDRAIVFAALHMLGKVKLFWDGQSELTGFEVTISQAIIHRLKSQDLAINVSSNWFKTFIQGEAD